MNRAFLQMISGAAGLIAAFTATALPLLLSKPFFTATGFWNIGNVSFLSLRILLAACAFAFLRFSLSHEETNRLLRFHSRSAR
ncbi:MAG TPA: hypothetical protein VJN64_07200 [Terriglobales bacterium]|nr:hypothetical protein [Terriglobales bacterium]